MFRNAIPAGGDMKTFGDARAARLAGREVEWGPEQASDAQAMAKAFAPLAKLAEQHQQTIETVDRLSPRRRRVFSSLKLSMGARLLRGRPHGHAPRNTSRLNAGRTRRPTRPSFNGSPHSVWCSQFAVRLI